MKLKRKILLKIDNDIRNILKEYNLGTTSNNQLRKLCSNNSDCIKYLRENWPNQVSTWRIIFERYRKSKLILEDESGNLYLCTEIEQKAKWKIFKKFMSGTLWSLSNQFQM